MKYTKAFLTGKSSANTYRNLKEVIIMSSFEKNLSEGNVAKQLVLFSLPFLASNIIQSLYSVADMLIVGRFSGTTSMSGVNLGSQVTLILTNIVVGLCAGGTVLIAQYLGAKRRKDMQETTATLLTTLTIAAVAITVLMLILKKPILHLIQTPAESFAEADRYLTVTVLGLIFIFGYNVFSAVMRGMGDSKRPLYFVLIACITNVILDLVLVAGLKMGALGAAIATVFSQAVSMITCIVVMIRNDFVFDFKPSSFIIKKEKAIKILKLGTPTAIQNSCQYHRWRQCISRRWCCGQVQQFCGVAGCGDGGLHFNDVCTEYRCRQVGPSSENMQNRYSHRILYQWMHLYCGADIFRAYFTPF